MPWLRKQSRTWHAVWRDDLGRTRSKSLKVTSKAEAQALLRDMVLPGSRRPVTESDAIQEFLAHRRLEGRSEGTISFYRGILTRTLGELAKTAPMRSWAPIHLRRHLERRPHWSDRTRQACITTCRQFVRWAREGGWDVPDFTAGLKVPRVSQAEVVPFTRAEVDLIFTEAEGHRLELPIGLAYYAGLSLGDLRAITAAEVDWKAWRIERPRQKTGEPLVLPVARPLRSILLRHRVISGTLCRGLGRNNVHRDLHRLQERAGVAEVPSGNGFHRYRHTGATHLVQAGAGRDDVRRFLGHRPGSNMTGRYVHPSLRAVERAVERAWG